MLLLPQVGTAETLLDDARRLAQRAREAGVSVSPECWDDMIHCFQVFAPMLDEAQQAIDRIGDFIRAKTQSEIITRVLIGTLPKRKRCNLPSDRHHSSIGVAKWIGRASLMGQ